MPLSSLTQPDLATPDLATRCRPLLGTFVEITVPDGFGVAVDAAFAAVAHIHSRMSFHEETSDLGATRRAIPGQPIALDRETVAVLRIALALHETSGGLFDVTIGRQLVESGFLPADGIDSLRQFVGGSSDIIILNDTHIMLRRPALIDLGGIAKGYAVDRAVETLAAHGVPFGIVNAGGDLRAFGPNEWQIGLRDADDVVRSALTIRQGALASSANLANRLRKHGTEHSPHIGKRGQPLLVGHRVTIMAEICVIADAMTKVAMADPELADRLLLEFKGHLVRDHHLVKAG